MDEFSRGYFLPWMDLPQNTGDERNSSRIVFNLDENTTNVICQWILLPTKILS